MVHRKIYAAVVLEFIFLFFATGIGKAQLKLPQYPDSLFSTYYHQRWSLFKALPKTEGDIIFIGNSITDGGEWGNLFDNIKVKNRGISGDITAGIINRLDEIVERKPAKVFLMIGVNDLARNISPDSVVKNILFIASYLRQETVSTKLYVQSVLPVNDIYGKFAGHTSKGVQIKIVNEQLKQNAGKYNYTFIDLHSAFCNTEGKLNTQFSNDGLHLKGEAYLLWKHLVFPYVYGLQQNPSLIPKPQSLQWNNGSFPIYLCKTIVVKEKTLQKEAVLLQQQLAQKGLHTSIKPNSGNEKIVIELNLAKIDAPEQPDEAYQLKVSNDKISITANTGHGIFNALQTLKQLMRDGSMINTCEITDWPAFPIRGYMVDVGRNFQSVKQLKQQIEVMAAYKLNIFHFHATEDIAWRMQSRRYPQLTAAKNMQRNAGKFYSIAEIKELINYCRERQITFLPEIDMPGHSAAFKRAMGVDMQSEKGVTICKNILTELCREFDVPYVHIGGDEVEITNKE
ncbi:MAG: family 20 glycosylhydrolase, partial [Chitinophagaceae bacterium]|nr:family 20 glycosylhydrolase [Chitinophagaceae bacterium]